MAEMTVRDHVKALQSLLLDQATASDGDTMRGIGNRAAALLGTTNAALLDAEMVVNHIEAAHLMSESAAKARVMTRATEEYRRLRQAENVHEELKAVLKATDNALRSLSFEMHLARG